MGVYAQMKRDLKLADRVISTMLCVVVVVVVVVASVESLLFNSTPCTAIVI